MTEEEEKEYNCKTCGETRYWMFAKWNKTMCSECYYQKRGPEISHSAYIGLEDESYVCTTCGETRYWMFFLGSKSTCRECFREKKYSRE